MRLPNFSFGAALLSALANPVDAQQSVVPPPSDSSLAPAPTSRPKLSKMPAFLSGSKAEFPSEAKFLGHHGKVMVVFEIDATGIVVATRLSRSSRSDLLDASALNAARTAVFSPAIDNEGHAIPFKFQAAYEFYQFKTSDTGGGFVHYRCDSFTRDMDWWEKNHPNTDGKGEHNKLDVMMLGFRTMYHPAGMVHGLRDGSIAKAHKADWANARKKCRANPDRLLVDFVELREFMIRSAKKEGVNSKP